MKAILYILILVLAEIPFIPAAQQNAQKKALLIGVGKYPVDGGWASLNSANDIRLIKEALQNQGFTPENISIISDENCTRDNILAGIKSNLIQKVKKGDIVFFHFSGHGQQKEDKDGDEIDAYDECLVPYDSPKKYVPGVYEGQKLITDDELRVLFADLRKKLGNTGHLLVSLDACHSGTGTRGAAIGRGTSEPMASPSFVQQHIQNKIQRENNQINNQPDSGGPAATLSPMIAFFGSAQNQINYEMTNDQGEQFGSLSYALSKFLVAAKKDESYRSLFDKIKVEMSTIAPNQQPQAEGDLDIEVLNGKALGAATHYKVISAADDDNIRINGGFLQGLNTGSVVGFFPQDTRDIENAKPLAKGKISKSLPTSSDVILDSVVDPGHLKNSWVYLLEQNMGEIKISLSINVSDTLLKKQIKSKLFSYPFIIEDSQKPMLLIEQKIDEESIPRISLSTFDGYEIESVPIGNYPIVVNKLNAKIIKYLKGLSLRKMSLENEDVKLSLLIIPVKENAGKTVVDSLVPLKEDEAGQRQLKVGDVFEIVVINEGSKPAYFNLIDLQPDNMYNILLPDKDQAAEEMKILPNQKKLIPKQWVVGEPLGNEIFKLIASSKPLDLRAVYGTRGIGEKNPFEKLFQDMEKVDYYGTRGSKPVPTGSMDINIYSESFIIVK